jgi:hypothetical protein
MKATNEKHLIFRGFLERQQEDAAGIVSDVVRVHPRPGVALPQHYLAEFVCRSAVRDPRGRIIEDRRAHLVGIFFPDDYLRRAEVPQVLTWMEPLAIFHPNIAPPYICVGRLVPGTRLLDLLYQIYELITFFKVTAREDDALQKGACSWARANLHRFPLDQTPLRRPTRLAPASAPPAA